MLKDPASITLAAFFSFLGIGISIYQVRLATQQQPSHLRMPAEQHSPCLAPQILCHLRNYTEPVFQVQSCGWLTTD